MLFARRKSRLAAHTLWLAEELLDRMRTQADEHAPLETGGMLLGWRDETGILITGLLDAGPAAERERHRFLPDGAWQQRQLETAYNDSGRTVTYLGDWHSHPHGSGRPSPRDRKTAQQVAAHAEARVAAPLTLILAKHRGEWQAHPHVLLDGKLRPVRLRATR